MRMTMMSLKRMVAKKLRSGQVKIRFARYNKPLKDEYVVWDNQTITILIDIHQTGLIPRTIHALLHVVINKRIEKMMKDDAEEAFVSQMEKDIWDSIRFSYRQLRYWRKIVDDCIVSK